MVKKIIAALFLTTLVFRGFCMPALAENEIIVYCTATGKCYHMSYCRTLTETRTEISLEDAVNIRGLTPCKVCNPPRLYTDGITSDDISDFSCVLDSSSEAASLNVTCPIELAKRAVIVAIANHSAEEYFSNYTDNNDRNTPYDYESCCKENLVIFDDNIGIWGVSDDGKSWIAEHIAVKSADEGCIYDVACSIKSKNGLFIISDLAYRLIEETAYSVNDTIIDSTWINVPDDNYDILRISFRALGDNALSFFSQNDILKGNGRIV